MGCCGGDNWRIPISVDGHTLDVSIIHNVIERCLCRNSPGLFTLVFGDGAEKDGYFAFK